MSACTYCGKPLRRRAWLSFVGTAQCDRLSCRVHTGHLWRGDYPAARSTRGLLQQLADWLAWLTQRLRFRG